ncbi:hypothetical protein F4808DRAFT_172833 [Astrocystis sublimbata]|nr:hypothetical protein F4808DRAFT_172833 [Astrocystis sublimbata]
MQVGISILIEPLLGVISRWREKIKDISLIKTFKTKKRKEKEAKLRASIRRRFSTNEEVLIYLYQDLTRLKEVASPDIAFSVCRSNTRSTVHVGIGVAQEWMERLVLDSHGSLLMDIHEIGRMGPDSTPFRSEEELYYFVRGVVRARAEGMDDLAVKFQHGWCFQDKLITEWNESDSREFNSREKIEKWLWHAKYIKYE